MISQLGDPPPYLCGGSFPDGNSALMLACTWLYHANGTQWGNKKYMNMKQMEAAFADTSVAE